MAFLPSLGSLLAILILVVVSPIVTTSSPDGRRGKD